MTWEENEWRETNEGRCWPHRRRCPWRYVQECRERQRSQQRGVKVHFGQHADAVARVAVVAAVWVIQGWKNAVAPVVLPLPLLQPVSLSYAVDVRV